MDHKYQSSDIEFPNQKIEIQDMEKIAVFPRDIFAFFNIQMAEDGNQRGFNLTECKE